MENRYSVSKKTRKQSRYNAETKMFRFGNPNIGRKFEERMTAADFVEKFNAFLSRGRGDK